MATNSTENAVNRQIQEYVKMKLLNTDNISDGTNTFGQLYDQLYKLDEVYNTCMDELTKCQSEENSVI